MMRFTAALVFTLVSLFACAPPALAQTYEDSEGMQTLAVQQRHHHHWHELSVAIGLLPLDAFDKGFTITGSYTLHFNHLFAWELVRAYGVVVEIHTDLRDDLQNLGIRPTQFETVTWSATSSFVFTPFYGKLAVVNRALIFTEWFFVLGAGYGKMTDSHLAVVDGGMGLRIFFGEYFSTRFDIRWEGFFRGLSAPHNELSVTLGVSVHLG